MALTTIDNQAIANAQAAYPNLPPGLLAAIATRESSGDPNAYNPSSGATGLFQVLPSTAANPGFGVAPLVNATDPNQSALFAAAYLTAQQQRTGSLAGAVNAYSGGGYQLGDLQGVQGQGESSVSGNIGGLAGGTSLGDIMHLGQPGGGTASPNTILSNTAGVSPTGSGGLISGIWETVERGVVLFSGFLIVLLALAALLWSSKSKVISIGKSGALL